MSRVTSWADRLAPNTINTLRRAAEDRVEDASRLVERKRFLAALYLFGYGVEMVLSASYFRSAGFFPNQPIDGDTRHRHMAKARQRKRATGQPLMEQDPHPLVGWARLLRWQRSASPELTTREDQVLKEAIERAELVYQYWRPELRYKKADVTMDQLEEVRSSAIWFIKNRDSLSGRD